MVAMTRRRDVLGAAMAASLGGAAPLVAAAEPPPETTRLRMSRVPTICLAPQYIAEALLRGEGAKRRRRPWLQGTYGAA